MANPDQVAILKKNWREWQDWRVDYPKEKIDLSGANFYLHTLAGLDLNGADLRSAHLNEANLSGADLAGADLREANVMAVYLDEANLEGANLAGTSLEGSRLVETNLRKANLEKADLCDATLVEADLTSANLREAELRKADLSRAMAQLADFSGADLTRATLEKADLWNANLSGAHLPHTEMTGADLHGANLSGADLMEAILTNCELRDTDLSGAGLGEAVLVGANLRSADLTGAHLYGARLMDAVLREADLTGADLTCANLTGATLVDTKLNRTRLEKCKIYGLSAWNLELEESIQSDFLITPEGEPEITVDRLEVAQFVYLLLNNPRIRDVIDTIGAKSVVILGRFTPDRKEILESIKDDLRRRGYVPILYDFEQPSSRDHTETISTLAHLARFVIVDLTEARSVPQELERIVPNLPSVPVKPIILASRREYALFEHFERYPWVLPTHAYEDQDHLTASMDEHVIEPAEAKVVEFRG
ncbi:MAG: pentapeptide repeat-containing protein [Thermoanaerobaculia bacterium]